MELEPGLKKSLKQGLSRGRDQISLTNQLYEILMLQIVTLEGRFWPTA